jgi:hypothetical protein
MSDVLNRTAPLTPCDRPQRHLSGVSAVLSRRCGPTGTASGLRDEEWVLRFPPRWRGRMAPLTGWWGGGDPLERLTLRFPTRRVAEDYARREGIRLEVSEDPSCPGSSEPGVVAVACQPKWLPVVVGQCAASAHTRDEVCRNGGSLAGL